MSVSKLKALRKTEDSRFMTLCLPQLCAISNREHSNIVPLDAEAKRVTPALFSRVCFLPAVLASFEPRHLGEFDGEITSPIGSGKCHDHAVAERAGPVRIDLPRNRLRAVAFGWSEWRCSGTKRVLIDGDKVL